MMCSSAEGAYNFESDNNYCYVPHGLVKTKYNMLTTHELGLSPTLILHPVFQLRAGALFYRVVEPIIGLGRQYYGA